MNEVSRDAKCVCFCEKTSKNCLDRQGEQTCPCLRVQHEVNVCDFKCTGQHDSISYCDALNGDVIRYLGCERDNVVWCVDRFSLWYVAGRATANSS